MFFCEKKLEVLVTLGIKKKFNKLNKFNNTQQQNPPSLYRNEVWFKYFFSKS